MSPTSTTATSTAIERVPHPGPRSDAEREQLMADPGFGRIHTDHMVVVRWTVDEGWHDAKLTAYAPLELDPSAMVLHYGQAIFEGLKAYRQPDGGVAIFRPEENAKRFNRSAARLAMPELPEELFLDAVDTLVEVDRDWVPTAEGQSLYLRPFMVATEAQVGMRPAHEYLFLLIAFPVLPFFSGEVKPVTVWLSDEYVRAAVGGTGEAKCAGQLRRQPARAAPGGREGLRPGRLARRGRAALGRGDGRDEPVLRARRRHRPHDAGAHRHPAARASCATRCCSWRPSSASPSRRAGCRSTTGARARGRLAVGGLRLRHRRLSSLRRPRQVQPGGVDQRRRPVRASVTLRLRSALLDLQYGRAADPHGWMRRVGA
jgi:branched-chain amino acid aminotransferase